MTEREKRQALVAKTLRQMIKNGEAVLHEKVYQTRTGSYDTAKFWKIII